MSDQPAAPGEASPVGSSAVRRSEGAALTGALQTVDHTLTGALQTPALPLPAGVMPLGPCVELGPSGLNFAAPVLVTVPYDETRLARLGLDESRVEVVTLPSGTGADGAAPAWRRLPVTARDPAANTVTVEPSHFSLFAPVTPSDLGCVWVLKFFIEQIDCGGQSTDGFISPFGDTD
ncbi:MAG: hypothetical protein HY719_15370, partial [Planctomycetes bacterium]|nr:hypothetical protein [Planctomycetota bacterium]